jgi:hypothetical protein
MSGLQVHSVAALLKDYPEPREPLIDGLLRRGEIMNIVAAPKSGKSMLVLDLAVSMSLGRDWLGVFQVRRGNVLLVDCELHAETLADRLRIVLEALGAAAEDTTGLNVLLARRAGGWAGVTLLMGEEAPLKNLCPDLIILDPVYRLKKGADHEENSNEDVARLYQQFDDLCVAHGCALVAVHHTSKGSQAGKFVTDVGAGAGAQSRAADCHLVLREHAAEGCYAMEAVTRSWPTLAATVFEYKRPRWAHRPDLNAGDLRRDSFEGRGRAKERRPQFALESIVAMAGPEPMAREDLIQRVIDAGESARNAERLVKVAVARKTLYEWRRGRNEPSRVATIPPPTSSSESPTKRSGRSRNQKGAA